MRCIVVLLVANVNARVLVFCHFLGGLGSRRGTSVLQVPTVSISCVYLMKKEDEKCISVAWESSLDRSRRMAPLKKNNNNLLPLSPPRHVPSPGEEPGTDLEQLVVGSLVRADKLTLTQRSRIMQMASPKQQPAACWWKTSSQPSREREPRNTAFGRRRTRRAGGGGEAEKKITPAEERKIQKQRRIQVTSMAESRRAAEAFNNLTVTSFILQP